MKLRSRSRRHAFVRLRSKAFEFACLGATLLCVLVLGVLIIEIVRQGAGWLSWNFLTGLPSRLPSKAGIWPALAGSLWLLLMTTVIAVPLGVGAAIYLEEYARPGRLRTLVQTNIANLAGVPSIVYGILGLGLFVRAVHLGQSLLSAALTLSLVVLPVVILASQEALRAVPSSLRAASFALGATRWQTVRHQVLPAAIPGIMTGVILALARALGEAAPLVTIGAVAFVPFAPSTVSDPFTALPLQIFNWSARPQEEFHHLAAAAVMVLLVMLLSMNAVAIVARSRASRRHRW